MAQADSAKPQSPADTSRYRKPRGFDRLMQYSGLWRLQGNTLPPGINHRYRRFHRRAQRAFDAAGSPPQGVLAEEVARLRDEGLCHAGNGLPRSAALALSEKLSGLIAAGGPRIQQSHRGAFRLVDPLDALGLECLELFDGQAGRVLEACYGSHFRIDWVDCYRTVADAERKTSWLWHSDNVPSSGLKVMLLLTDSARETGAMRYLPRKISTALNGAGYFGIRVGERRLDLGSFAARAAIVPEPRYREAPAGDVLVFDPNILHCGEPPQRGYRDVMTFFMVPSLISWRDALRVTGTQRLQSSPGGYPSSPAL